MYAFTLVGFTFCFNFLINAFTRSVLLPESNLAKDSKSLLGRTQQALAEKRKVKLEDKRKKREDDLARAQAELSRVEAEVKAAEDDLAAKVAEEAAAKKDEAAEIEREDEQERAEALIKETMSLEEEKESEGKGMFRYMNEVGFADSVPSEEEQAEILVKIYEPMWPELIFNKWKLNQYTLILIGESLSDDYIEEIESEFKDYQEKSKEEQTEILKELIDEWKEEIKEDENAELGIAVLNSLDLIKLKVGRSYKNEPYIYGVLIWNIPDYEIDGKSEFIFTTIDKKIFATISTCYRNCFDTNNFFSEILEPTNLLKDIEKKGIIEIDDSDGLTKQLNDLNELYKSGVLTEDEFKKAKNKILN